MLWIDQEMRHNSFITLDFSFKMDMICHNYKKKILLQY